MSISVLSRARWIFSVMVVTVFSALVLVGCGKDDDDGGGNDSALIGTWVSESPMAGNEITFTDSKVIVTDDGKKIEIPYTTSGGKLKIEGEGEVSYSIKNGKLTITDEDGEITVFVKKT